MVTNIIINFFDLGDFNNEPFSVASFSACSNAMTMKLFAGIYWVQLSLQRVSWPSHFHKLRKKLQKIGFDGS